MAETGNNVMRGMCTQKFRGEKGNIIGYRITYENQQTQDVTPDVLKNAIRSNKVVILNLKLTSDNRLVDCNPTSQLANGTNASVSSNFIKGAAKAFTYFDRAWVDMGDSLEEIVEGLCYEAKYKFDKKKAYADKSYLYNVHIKAYEKLLSDKNSTYDLEFVLANYCDSSDRFIQNMVYSNETEIGERNRLIHELGVLIKYAEYLVRLDKCSMFTYNNLLKMKQKAYTVDIPLCVFAHQVGATFFNYLSPNYFAVKSNTSHTVGHITVDPKEKQLGEYIFNAGINKVGLPSNVGFTGGFRRNGTEVSVVFYSYVQNTGVYDVDYFPTTMAYPIKEIRCNRGNITKVSSEIANIINVLAAQKFGGAPKSGRSTKNGLEELLNDGNNSSSKKKGLEELLND